MIGPAVSLAFAVLFSRSPGRVFLFPYASIRSTKDWTSHERENPVDGGTKAGGEGKRWQEEIDRGGALDGESSGVLRGLVNDLQFAFFTRSERNQPTY